MGAFFSPIVVSVWHLCIFMCFFKTKKKRKSLKIKDLRFFMLLRFSLKKESTGFEPARPLYTGSPDFESGALPLCQLSIKFPTSILYQKFP